MRGLFGLLVLILVLAASAPVQSRGDCTVGDITLDNVNWGKGTSSVTIVNNSRDLKFIVVLTDVDFIEATPVVNRRVRSSFAVLPMENAVLRPEMIVPGNYGAARITLRFYDVVDTVDQLLESQLFHSKELSHEFPAPASVQSYLTQTITLPPRVTEHPYFDHQISRLLLLMIAEGKSVAEISAITGASETYVDELAQFMVRNGYVNRADSGFTLAFTAISHKEALEAGALALSIADSLGKLIEQNLPAYRSKLQEMVASGTVAKDSSYFMNGGTVLYHLYPAIAALSRGPHRY